MSEREKERERVRTEHRKQYLWIQSDRGEEGSRVPEMVRPLRKAANDWTDQAAERARVRKRERESGRRNALSRKSRRECGFIGQKSIRQRFRTRNFITFCFNKRLE